MSSIPTHSLGLDEEFVAACLASPEQVRYQSPFSPVDTPCSTTAPSFSKPSLSDNAEIMAADDIFTDSTRLTDKYPNAYSDFYGSGTPCVFKSGPVWNTRTGPEAQGIEREARPVYDHAIGSAWLSIGERIYHSLDSLGVKWTSINPLAYANAGEIKPFCALILCVGVLPYSLQYDAAIVAATVTKEILNEAGFPGIEVAFLESIVTRSAPAGPKLLSFDPSLDIVPDQRKPFSPALGLPIAPRKYPYFEGTGTLYFRLGKDDERIALLTCAHVARPSPKYPNTGMSYKFASQQREEFIALGEKSYSNAVNAILRKSGDLLTSINAWKNVLTRLGEPIEGEPSQITRRRKDYEELVATASYEIMGANALHDEVAKYRTTPAQRVIGFLLHSEKITVVEPHRFNEDWALIQLYNEKIDWHSFKGNKVYIGGKVSIADFRNIMFPNVVDHAHYQYPPDGLLQAYGVVPETEIQKPQHLDGQGRPCLFVIKNGLATGTTTGCANGLQAFTRIYDDDYKIEETAIEIAVLSCGENQKMFSDAGDSGSVVLARDGRIVGVLTGGGGPTHRTNITYLTPYWWLEKQIKAKFPGCFLYEVVE